MTWKKRKILNLCSSWGYFSLNTRLWALRKLGHELHNGVFYGIDNLIIEGEISKLVLHDNAIISARVTFLLSSGPHNSNLAEIYEPNDKDIVVGDNAWIGTGCIIYPGVTIGKGSIVNAGSIVTKDVPPHTLVQGIPAKYVKTLPSLL